MILEWEEMRLLRKLSEKNNRYKDRADKIHEYACNVLPKANRLFANYTGHDVQHSFHVMEYMYDLIVNIDQLSGQEIMVMICVALLHDVGMAVTENEIDKIKNGELVYRQKKYTKVVEKLGDETIALQEIIRPAHGVRAYDHIKQMKPDYFLVEGYSNCNFQEEVGRICQAHNESFSWIDQNLDSEKMKGTDTFHARYIAMLLRIADYLDIDESRTPLYLYNMTTPKGSSDLEWRQHYIIENGQKIFVRESSFYEARFSGHCNDPTLYRKLMMYLSCVQDEIKKCVTASARFDKKYRIPLWPEIDNKIQTKDFTMSDLRFQVDYHAISKFVLGEKLYGNKQFGLRELIQNAADACQVMREQSTRLSAYKYTPYTPVIQLIADFNENVFVVKDNGIGMTEEVLNQYFLNIGKSYYRSDAFLFQGTNYEPIGNYGIGFLSCFMLSNAVRVESKSFHDEEPGFLIELVAGSPYLCRKALSGLIQYAGTAVTLELDGVIEAFGGSAKKKEDFVKGIENFVMNTFLDMDIRFELVCFRKQSVENHKIALPKWKDIINKKAVLDPYLKDVSIGVELDCEQIKVDTCLTDICNDSFGSNEVYEFDPQKGRLVKREIFGETLKKYIKGIKLMVIKFTGIKEENREKVRNHDALTMLKRRTIIDEFTSSFCVPILFDENLLKEIYSSHNNDSSAMIWYYLSEEKNLPDIGEIFCNSAAPEAKYTWDQFYHDAGFCQDLEVSMELGITNVLEIDENKYIEIQDEWRFWNTVSIHVYLRGVLLTKAHLDINGVLTGVKIGNCIVNISDPYVKSNIARDDLSDEDRNHLSRKVQNAVYQWVRDHTKDDQISIGIEKMLENMGGFPFE